MKIVYKKLVTPQSASYYCVVSHAGRLFRIQMDAGGDGLNYVALFGDGGWVSLVKRSEINAEATPNRCYFDRLLECYARNETTYFLYIESLFPEGDIFKVQ